MKPGLTAGRVAALRTALASAALAAEYVPALAGLVEIASELCREGGPRADDAGPILGEVLGYLQAARGRLTVDGQDDRRGQSPQAIADEAAMLYLEAEACLLRDSEAGYVSDLDNAIECLRRLRPMLADGSDERAEVDAKLASAALTRAGRPGGSLAGIDEAGILLVSLLDRTAPGDPTRRQVVRSLALQRGVRFISFGGTKEDRLAGIGYARECLALPAPGGAPDDTAEVSHFMIAWLTLARQATRAQRSMFSRQAEIEGSRRDGAIAAALLAELGTIEISGADAEAALVHLRQVGTTPADAKLRRMSPVLWALALIGLVRDGDPNSIAKIADDLRRVTADLESAASQDPQDATELLAVRAMLLGLLTQATDGTSQAPEARVATEALRDSVTRLPPGHPARQAGLGLLKMQLNRQVAQAGGAGDVAAGLDQVMAALDGMSPDDPDFASLIASVSTQVLSLGVERRSALDDDRLASQLERAMTGMAADDPMLAFTQAMYWVHSGAQGILRQRPEVVDPAIAELKKRAEAAPDGYMKTFLLCGVGYALADRHAMGGEIRHLEEAEEYATRAFASIDPASSFGEGGAGLPGLLYLRAHLELMWCYYDNDVDRVRRAITDLERASAQVAADSPLRPMVANELEVARAAGEMLAGLPSGGMPFGSAARAAFGNLLEAAENLGRDHAEYPTLIAQVAGGLALRGLADNDPEPIDRAIAMLGDACTLPGLAVRERPRLLASHGFALMTRYLKRPSPRDLSNAIARLEEARRAVEQAVGSPYAAGVLQTLASAYRMRGDAARGDVDRAVTYGLEGLREHAGDVLLQDSDVRALHVARRGTSDATEMARWFLAHGRQAAAIGALELGRGMVLHAATSGAGVLRALREAGHEALAAEWAGQAPHGGPAPDGADLRYRVMLAIEQSPAEARLLSPPSVGDIAEALTATGADALAYLVPRDEDGTGIAVLVDQAKDVHSVPLPGLTADERGPVPAFARARRAADLCARRLAGLRARQAAGPPSVNGQDLRAAQAAASEAAAAWEAALGPVCEWAWKAAIEPLLGAIPVRNGRDRRIVIVPGGELGLVPWHAARDPADGRYACQHAVFSYASSARQFTDAASHRPRPWEQAPVLISDAARSLRLTAAGIRHLHAEHYPAASVFGYARVAGGEFASAVPGTGAATPGDVLAALPGALGPGASVLHFGCHGRAEVPVLHSRLDLGAGGTLAVQDILVRARAWRSGQHPQDGACGLVVLASCLSDVADADYDEALTLATAFLSAGAAGVVAARWRVTESATALLMSAFHRYLNAGLGPALALREAQLWMIDPGREVPGGLPKVLRDEAEMDGGPDGPDLVSPAAWAGFGYQGR